MDEEPAAVKMISTLNKQGINQLWRGDYESSIATFRLHRAHVRAYARTISCKGIHCRHTTHLQAVEMQQPEIADNGSIFFPVVFCHAIEDEEEEEEDEAGDEIQGPHEQAPNLASNLQNRCRLCQRTVGLQSAMICYNLAMAYHFRSMRKSLHRSSDAQIAIQFYRFAMTLTDSIQPSLRDGSGRLMVSLGNNLAFLLAETCDFEAVGLCIAWTLTQFPTASEMTGPFLSNAVIWRMLETQPAAAA